MSETSSSDTRPLSPSLIDAKAASQILSVPASWLLTRARQGRIPHHRLGHYVRFSEEDLQQLAEQARIVPYGRR
jgi:excisionase family DNA binding protein